MIAKETLIFKWIERGRAADFISVMDYQDGCYTLIYQTMRTKMPVEIFAPTLKELFEMLEQELAKDL
jgi:hypothetical protein